MNNNVKLARERIASWFLLRATTTFEGSIKELLDISLDIFPSSYIVNLKSSILIVLKYSIVDITSTFLGIIMHMNNSKMIITQTNDTFQFNVYENTFIKRI